MRHLLIPCLLATGAIVAGTAPPARAQNDAMAACKAAAGAYMAAINSGDPAKIAAQYTADGVLTTPEGIFQGPRAIASYEASFVKPGVSDVDTFDAARMIGGNVVVCSGGYTFTFAPGGPMREVRGNWTKVLARSGDGWRLEQLTFNYTPSPTPSQPQRESRAR